jgi:hypothetical protein
MIGVTAAFGALAVAMVALRLIYRGLSTSAQLGADDLLIGLSGVSLIHVFTQRKLNIGRRLHRFSKMFPSLSVSSTLSRGLISQLTQA